MNVDPDDLVVYINATKDDDTVLMWMWGDEPYLHEVWPPVLRSKTYLSHKLDPAHLVDTNYAGFIWAAGGWLTDDRGSAMVRRRGYLYSFNADYFGGKRTPVTDTIGFDYYPVDRQTQEPGANTTSRMITVLERIQEENYNLVPVLSFIEASDIDKKDPIATPEQMRAFAWLNVIHGAKGIKWIPLVKYPPAENFGVMAEFLDHITELTEIVLGPETDRAVTDTADEMGSRVDTMIRDNGEDIWLITARVTEVGEPQDNDDLSVTFTVDGLTQNMSVIEPSKFSQSIMEYEGNHNDDEGRKEFTFTLANTPILPKSVIISGRYSDAYSSCQINLYDDGGGEFSVGNRVRDGSRNAGGTVDYTTGAVHVDFGEINVAGWQDVSILDDSNMVRVVYRQDKGDRSISHTGNTFTDTFTPNAVHIYRIGASSGGNHAPVLDPIGSKSVSENSALTFTVSATDTDGDTITYSAKDLPTEATFTGQSFSWTPGYTQAGSYDVNFIATDGEIEDIEIVTITVNNVNRKPVVEPISDMTVDENTTVTFAVNATDPDGNDIAYFADNLPDGAVFSSQTFEWTPGYSQAGIYIMGFIAADGELEDLENVVITVNDIESINPIYRFWSDTLETHFYTISERERQKLIDLYSHVWTYEGIASYASPEGQQLGDTMPVYRFWSGALQTHFYTISESEKNNLIDNYPHVWTSEGIAWYAYSEGQQPADTLPVYRFWSSSLESHFYTMRESEKQKLIDLYSHVWTYEGIAWYSYN